MMHVASLAMDALARRSDGLGDHDGRSRYCLVTKTKETRSKQTGKKLP